MRAREQNPGVSPRREVARMGAIFTPVYLFYPDEKNKLDKPSELGLPASFRILP